MTCIAVKNGIMAADSRVSGDYITPGVKLQRCPDCIIGFAGDVTEAMVFIDWYQDKRNRQPDVGHETNWCALVMFETHIEYWDKSLRGFKLLETIAAIGSGAPLAIGAMDAGKSAKEAVRIACRRDNGCGLPVVTMSLRKRKR